MAERTEELTAGEEGVLFYYLVGLAISNWATVEASMLRFLLGGFKDQIHHSAIGVAFYALEGARAKREFTEAFVNRALLGHPRKAEWTKLIERVKQATDKRNNLAHWQMQFYEKARPGRRYALEHPVQNKKRPKTKVPLPRPGALCVREIFKIHAEFMALHYAFSNFHARLLGEKEPFSTSAELPSNPPQIGRLRRLMLETLARILQTQTGGSAQTAST
jgi:hypothetical protein